MKIIRVLDNENFMEFLELAFKENSEYTFHLQTWQDGDSFLDTCDDDGGIKSEQLMLFTEKNQNHIFKTKNDLFAETKKFIEYKSFSSKNGCFKLGYEICITCKDDYFVLCPELNKGYYAKLNIFNRLIGFFFYKEPWENEKFFYWEKQGKK